MVAVESIIFEGRLSELLPDGSDWREHAVCKGRTRLFFPPKAARREAQARLLCSTCPVQANCQQFARANHEYGFWGGESEEDRHLLGYTVSAPIGVRARNGIGVA